MEREVNLNKGYVMLSWAFMFLILAIVAALLGFGGVAGIAATIAKILFVVFLIALVISLFVGRRPTSKL